MFACSLSDWTSGVQIRQAGLCEYNDHHECERGEKAATYRLHTSTYLEEIEVHCLCPNPLAPVLPMTHQKKGNLLMAEFKRNEVSILTLTFACQYLVSFKIW